ncbi:MAG: CaiB/BaiF CoA transferase family protein [Acidimicrobiia bacterium]
MRMWPESDRDLEGPLAGLRVVDFSRILAGPYATMILADLGADVIKIERPQVGDETRRWGPPFVRDRSGEPVGTYYFAVNRNKRSVEVDLKTEEGRELAYDLCEVADVAVHNFLPESAASLGVSPDVLRKKNPRLVVASITGFGNDNPYADRPGFDFVIQAMGGLMSITGPVGGPPLKVGVAIADLAAGLYAAIGILAALHQRSETDVGAVVEVALLDSQVSLLVNQAMNYLLGGINPEPMGNVHPNIAPYETFRTADREIALGVGTDRQFQHLCNVLGCPELAEDDRFSSNDGRIKNREELSDLLETSLTSRTAAEWLVEMLQAGIPCGPVNTVADVFADPVIAERLLVQLEAFPQVNSPIRIHGRPSRLHTPPPPLGSDNRDVFEKLGEDGRPSAPRAGFGKGS